MKVLYERVYGFLTDIRLIRGTYKGEQKRQIFRAYLSFYLQRLMKGSSNVTVDVLGYTMQVPDFHMLFEMFKEIFIRNTYHFSTTEKAPRIIDCGGNIGMSVLYFKWLYPDAKITVFEPSPSTVKILRNNIERNALKDVEVVNEALGEKVGKISLFSRIGDRPG